MIFFMFYKITDTSDAGFIDSLKLKTYTYIICCVILHLYLHLVLDQYANRVTSSVVESLHPWVISF